MSGFGGFGSAPPFGAPQAPPAFGAAQQPQTSPPPAFGQPFGASTNSPAGSFGRGGFGASPPAQPTFGQPVTAPAFGQPATFGQPSMGATPVFVQPSTAGGGFGSNNPTPASGGFGSTAPFGTSSNMSAEPFGSSAASAPFGSSAPFGGQPQQQQLSNVPNPFGGPASSTPAPAMSFGMSSNIVTNTNSGNQGGTMFSPPSTTASGFGSSSNTTFGQPASSSGFGSSRFGGSSDNAAPPFGTPSHQWAESIEMDGSGNNSPLPSRSQPMNQQQATSSSTAFGSPFHTMDNTGSGSLSPIPEDNMGDSSGGLVQATQQQSAAEEKLARLKAKLEAKKAKLEAKKNKKDHEGGGSNDGTSDNNREAKHDTSRSRHNRSNSTSPAPLNPKAPAFAPGNKSQAERNAIRFATFSNTATQDLLPADLLGKSGDASAVSAPSTKTTSGVDTGTAREHLATAKSLVGTCMYMCPDEELLRRERESDIQLLEIPDPGGIHPANWTLRNTAVKRFRRSAADYKLDVPEWVRPPDVLERVCAYLEEWIIERDRQGPDQRFPNQGTPNSMDVYQFVWDRTRMIRKDFILQNYVGTGGACDARAVRCHERIARWHAMCEHQLSHISDFVVMQSQQNIQELGQAMKTLNQYYDDAYGRAIVEVPDDQGRETRTDLTGFSHGCESDICQGVAPVDYDGSTLNNSPSRSTHRLIGKIAINSPTRGTAEPEMRGLYILLTMNNDGGMEVMKYSARIYRERPEVYYSKPVQLALSIYKAKKEYNYVRFFAILQDPSTPYLFACIMFKHVELMRKVAFRIMSKTYGARRKENGEPIYDAYPLKKLAYLLCFEDIDEARAACKHYNITVKEAKIRSSSSPNQSTTTEIVFWRHSEFKERKDPEKGVVIPLRPRKMMKYIESKLNGSTRLAVCRGEVSGDGATLSKVVRKDAAAVPQPIQRQPMSAGKLAQNEAAQLLIKQQQENLMREDETRKKEEAEQRRKKKEEERKEAERVRLEKAEAERLQRQKMKEEEEKKREQKRLEEEEMERELERRREQERREKAEKEAQERKRRAEAERKRQMEEAARFKAQAEERERQRLEAIRLEEERKQRLIQEEQERLKREEEDRRRKELERQRLEALRLQEEERLRQEAIARQAALELEKRIDRARKLLLWRRWRQRFPRHLQARESVQRSLSFMDPTFSKATTLAEVDGLEDALAEARSVSLEAPKLRPAVNIRKVLERLLGRGGEPLDLSSTMANALLSGKEHLEYLTPRKIGSMGAATSLKSTVLFKVAVFLPEPSSYEDECMCALVHDWLDSRLEYGVVDVYSHNIRGHTIEVRFAFVRGNTRDDVTPCNAALFVVPSPWSAPERSDFTRMTLSSTFASVSTDTPRVVYVLGEEADEDYYEEAHQFVASCLPYTTDKVPVAFPSAISESAVEGGLVACMEALISELEKDFPPLIERISVTKLACICICDAIWESGPSTSRKMGTTALDDAKAVLLALLDELENIGNRIAKSWSGWPMDDFAEGGSVRSYFVENTHLPLNWASNTVQEKAKPLIMDFHKALAGSLPDVIERLLYDAPGGIREECDAMIQSRQNRRCIQRALVYLQDAITQDEFLFLPKGTAEAIVNSSVKTVVGSLRHDSMVDAEEIEVGDEEMYTNTEPSLVANADEDKGGDGDQEAEDIFEISRTISPVPGSLSPQLGSNDPPTPTDVNNSSNKRSWMGMSRDDGPFPTQEDVPFSLESEESRSKRRRNELLPPSSHQRSRDVKESAAFTKKLEALLNGGTVDMPIGTTRLAHLVRDAPDVEVIFK